MFTHSPFALRSQVPSLLRTVPAPAADGISPRSVLLLYYDMALNGTAAADVALQVRFP